MFVLVRCGLKRLLDSLLLLQTTMLASNADTKPVLEADDSSAQHSNTQLVKLSVFVCLDSFLQRKNNWKPLTFLSANIVIVFV